MSKSSFTVVYSRGNKEVVVAGVTSIFPNLNGFLFNTEDGENHFIESCDLIDQGLSSISFEYQYTDEDFEDFANFPCYELHDHRKKQDRKDFSATSKMGQYYTNKSHLGTVRTRA